jgi:hypothetical protein
MNAEGKIRITEGVYNDQVAKKNPSDNHHCRFYSLAFEISFF